MTKPAITVQKVSHSRIDECDFDNLVFGNVFSDHYKDLTQKYLNGEFVKMLLNQEAIEKSKNRLVFKKAM